MVRYGEGGISVFTTGFEPVGRETLHSTRDRSTFDAFVWRSATCYSNADSLSQKHKTTWKPEKARVQGGVTRTSDPETSQNELPIGNSLPQPWAGWRLKLLVGTMKWTKLINAYRLQRCRRRWAKTDKGLSSWVFGTMPCAHDTRGNGGATSEWKYTCRFARNKPLSAERPRHTHI